MNGSPAQTPSSSVVVVGQIARDQLLAAATVLRLDAHEAELPAAGLTVGQR